MKHKTVDIDHGFKRIGKEIRLLRKKPHVKAGLMGSTKHKGSSGTRVVDIGITHEFGSPEKNIPQRPFIRSSFDEKKEACWTKTRRLKKLILSGRMTVSRALDILGLTIERDQKTKIRIQDPSWPELSDATIKQKKSTKKLIDTAQMMNAITHKKVMRS